MDPSLTRNVGGQDYLQHFLSALVIHPIVEEDMGVSVDGDGHWNRSVHDHHQPVQSKLGNADEVIIYNSPDDHHIHI